MRPAGYASDQRKRESSVSPNSPDQAKSILLCPMAGNSWTPPCPLPATNSAALLADLRCAWPSPGSTPSARPRRRRSRVHPPWRTHVEIRIRRLPDQRIVGPRSPASTASVAIAHVVYDLNGGRRERSRASHSHWREQASACTDEIALARRDLRPPSGKVS